MRNWPGALSFGAGTIAVLRFQATLTRPEVICQTNSANQSGGMDPWRGHGLCGKVASRGGEIKCTPWWCSGLNHLSLITTHAALVRHWPSGLGGPGMETDPGPPLWIHSPMSERFLPCRPITSSFWGTCPWEPSPACPPPWRGCRSNPSAFPTIHTRAHNPGCCGRSPGRCACDA
jgi:hypothetical protein